MRSTLLAAALAMAVPAVMAKLPPLSDDAKAKAAEAAAKTAHGNKVADYKLCQSMDKVAAKYVADAKKAGKDVAAGGDAAVRRPGPVRLYAARCGACSSRPRPPPAPQRLPATAAPAGTERGLRLHRRLSASRSTPRRRAFADRTATKPPETAARGAGNEPAPQSAEVATAAAAWRRRVAAALSGGATVQLMTPRLTQARAPLTQDIDVRDEFGATRRISIPAERPLTVYVDKRELVTLMTLGAAPEWLVLGYLRNQRLVSSLDAIESVTVDWDVGSAAVNTRGGIDDIERKTSKRVVTTGCGQGTVFGDLMDELDSVQLPAAADARIDQPTLYGLLDAVRRQESTYKSAGSVHGCALFRGDEMLLFIEDVGRHNAIDTIAGWMWLNGTGGGDKSFYTTGRLTSEMVIKSAQMGVPIVVSRSGITQMGYEVASRLGLALFGRATNRHFICYCGFERFDAVPEPALATASRS